MAVHASTETSVRQLTNQQREIAVHLGEALTATQVSLRKQIQHLQSVQDERGSQIESYFSDRLSQASQDVQNEVSQKLMLMECNMDGTISRMMEQVQKLIEDRSVISNLEEKTVPVVQLQMEKSTDHVAAKVMEYVLKIVDEKLAMVRGETSYT